MSDLNLDRLITVDEAIAILDATPVLRRAEATIAPPSSVIGAAVIADRDYPPFDKSLVDGYAVRAADLPGTLPCVGEVAAGHAWTGDPISPGTCVAIMTGAPLPPGADAVVPVEQTTAQGDRVAFDRAPKVGQSIARRGSDAQRGDVVLRIGASIGPAQVAALAQVGALTRDVEDAFLTKPTPAGSVPSDDDATNANRPHSGRLGETSDRTHNALGATAQSDRVAPLRAHVLVTGDEVVPHEAPLPTPDAIRDANGPALVALLSALGVAATRSHVGDSPEATRDAIDRLSREHDVLFVTGGMSMGRHDHVPATLRGLGFALPITKVRMKPGKPFVFATRDADGRIVFGLPGNPVSGFVCTLRFAARVVRRMLGQAAGDDLVDATLAAPLPANGPREFYQPATLRDGVATPLDWKGSADVFTLARADALIVRPADDPPRAAGDGVRALRIPR